MPWASWGPGPRRRVNHKGLPMWSRTGSKEVSNMISLSRFGAGLKCSGTYDGRASPMGPGAAILHGFAATGRRQLDDLNCNSARGAMSLALLWRDQGKPQQARELLAPVYG